MPLLIRHNVHKGGMTMEETEDLRHRLIDFVRKKFYTRRGINDAAEDIVNQAFLDIARAQGFSPEMYNFGYMSAACVRGAYKIFHRSDAAERRWVSPTSLAPLIDEDDFVEEIIQADDTAVIVQSLFTLKEVEQTIIRERYFGDFTFREISERHNINLNTVLTHHRRALNKLRPILVDLWR